MPEDFLAGPVTGVTDGGAAPDRVNVDTGGPDGTDALWCWPGRLQSGDQVVIQQFGNVWLVTACTSRKVLPPDIGSVIDFMPTTPPDGAQLSTPYRRADSTAARPHLTYVYSDGVAPPVPVGGNSASMTATGGGTWDEVNNWRQGVVRQGVYPGFPHQAFGLWFLGASPVPAGTSVTGCTVAARRTPNMGAGGPIDLQLYTHGYTSPPAGQPSMTGIGTFKGAPQGASTSFTLPLAVAQGIAAGSIVGLGITASSVDQYAGYDPGLTLTFSY